MDGHGYFDANFGTRALEQDFDYWTWGRFLLGKVPPVSMTWNYAIEKNINLNIISKVMVWQNIADAPQNSNFSNSLWGIKRKTRCDKHSKPKQEKAS